jgi:hypothetical protein
MKVESGNSPWGTDVDLEAGWLGQKGDMSDG